MRGLHLPNLEVFFSPHHDIVKWGAACNSQKGGEWASRLTTWVNNSRLIDVNHQMSRMETLLQTMNKKHTRALL